MLAIRLFEYGVLSDRINYVKFLSFQLSYVIKLDSQN